MDVGVPGGEVELEIGAVVYQLVSYFNDYPRALLLQVATDHRHQDGLDVLDLLDEQFLAEADCQFEAIGELGMPLADDLHLLLALLQPLDGLIVGVENQRNGSGIEDHHRILNRERIAGQPLALPLQLHTLTDHILQEVVTLRFDLEPPVFEDHLPLVLIAVAEVGDEGGGDERVDGVLSCLLLDVAVFVVPSHALVLQLGQ